MTIAKCKECCGAIMTPEHLENKKNVICWGCVPKYFKKSMVDGYLICLQCGVAVLPRLRDVNEHLQEDIKEHSPLNEKEKGQ